MPVNFTSLNVPINNAFVSTYDHLRGGFLDDIAWLLDDNHNHNPTTTTTTNNHNSSSSSSKVSVHLIYGDRDYASNWVGGEAASLAVPYTRRVEFAEEAGYAQLFVPVAPPSPPPNITTATAAVNDGGKGDKGKDDEDEQTTAGLTRQLGRFSFTRVFQAGHMVPAYAPSAAHAIFTRAVSGRDIATGRVAVTGDRDNDGDRDGQGEDEGKSGGDERSEGKGEDYRTHGPRTSWAWWSLEPPFPNPRCYVLVPESCVPEVWGRVRRGEVRVRDWFVVDDGDVDSGESDDDSDNVDSDEKSEEGAAVVVVGLGEDSQVRVGEL